MLNETDDDRADRYFHEIWNPFANRIGARVVGWTFDRSCVVRWPDGAELVVDRKQYEHLMRAINWQDWPT